MDSAKLVKNQVVRDDVYLVGYSGHSYVVCDIIHSRGDTIRGYFEKEIKSKNPYKLTFLGSEFKKTNIEILSNSGYFIAIGNNSIRRAIASKLLNETTKPPINVIHKNSFLSPSAKLGNGILISHNVTINACSKIGDGTICNTNSIIEHESLVGAYSHIAPGAILCGNVEIGENSFIGAGAVIKEGVKIGANVIVGAGTIVLSDVPENSKVVGNPHKLI